MRIDSLYKKYDALAIIAAEFNSSIYIYIYIDYVEFVSSSSASILPEGRYFTTNSGTKVTFLLKGRPFTTNSGTQVAIFLGMDRCGSFPLLSAPHSLFSI